MGIHTTIIDGYMGLLNNLSPNDKLELISKLSTSVKANLKPKKNKFKSAFGAMETSKTAEEIIEELKQQRSFKRDIESF